MPTRKWSSVFCLTSRSVRIVLPGLVLIPEVSIIIRQESRRHWTNTSFEWKSPPKIENTPQVPTATREKQWDFPIGERPGLIPLHCIQSNSVFPIKHVSSPDLLDGTPESPQEHLPKSRMTLMSPKECEIVRCIPNQLEMTPDCTVLDLDQSAFPHNTRQVACLPLGYSRDCLRHSSQI